MFRAAQILQQRSFQSFNDLRNFMTDFICDKNAVQAKSEEIEDVCQFVSEIVKIFQEHFASCQNLVCNLA